MNYSIWTISCFVLCCKMFSGYILLSFLFSLNSKLLVNGNSTFHGQLAYHVTRMSQWCCNLSSKQVLCVVKKEKKFEKLSGLQQNIYSLTHSSLLWCKLFTCNSRHSCESNFFLWWIAFPWYIVNGCCARPAMLSCYMEYAKILSDTP